jgi:hypothetical protein
MHQKANFKHYTRGGQISFHNLRMWDQITKTLTMICLFIWVIITTFFTWYFTSSNMFMQTCAHFVAQVLDWMGHRHTFEIPYHGQVLKQSTFLVAHHPFYVRNAAYFLNSFYKAAQLGFFVAMALGLVLIIYFIRNGKKQTDNQFIRGASLVSPRKLKKQIIKAGKASDLRIDGFPLLENSEVQHLLVHGTVGMGKSQFIMKLMDCLRSRGDRVIVYDKGCTFTQHYFREECDALLNFVLLKILIEAYNIAALIISNKSLLNCFH